MPSVYLHQPIDLARLSTYPLASQYSKVTVRDFARTLSDDEARLTAALLDSLPNILAAETLRAVTAIIIRARSESRAIIRGLGGHVIKTGLAPILTDLMKRLPPPLVRRQKSPLKCRLSYDR